MRAWVPPWSKCQRACVPAWFTCQRACLPAWLMCQRACVPTCQKRANFLFLRVNVPKNVPTCHKTYQCFNLVCQRAKRRTNISTWRANVPESVPIFQTFILRNAKGNFYTSLKILHYTWYHTYTYHVYMYRTYQLYYTILFETFLLFR